MIKQTKAPNKKNMENQQICYKAPKEQHGEGSCRCTKTRTNIQNPSSWRCWEDIIYYSLILWWADRLSIFPLLIILALGYEVEELHLFIYLLVLKKKYFSSKPSTVKAQHQSLWPSSQAFQTLSAFGHCISIHHCRYTTLLLLILNTGRYSVSVAWFSQAQTLTPAIKDRSYSTCIKETWNGKDQVCSFLYAIYYYILYSTCIPLYQLTKISWHWTM